MLSKDLYGGRGYEHNITYHGSRFGTGIKQLERKRQILRLG
jgi:hypothetical protein